MRCKPRKKLLKLFAAKPHCHWCGRLTVLLPEVPQIRGKIPWNAATIDHLRSRYDPKRQEPVTAGEIRLVLACWRCNNERCQQEQNQIGKEELNRRSQEGKRRWKEKLAKRKADAMADRLLGSVGDQITESEKLRRLQEIADRMVACMKEPVNDGNVAIEHIKRMTAIREEEHALDCRYPDLPPENICPKCGAPQDTSVPFTDFAYTCGSEELLSLALDGTLIFEQSDQCKSASP